MKALYTALPTAFITTGLKERGREGRRWGKEQEKEQQEGKGGKKKRKEEEDKFRMDKKENGKAKLINKQCTSCADITGDFGDLRWSFQ